MTNEEHLAKDVRVHCARLDISQAELARQFGVGAAALCNVLAGRSTSAPLARKLQEIGIDMCTDCGRASCPGCTDRRRQPRRNSRPTAADPESRGASAAAPMIEKARDPEKSALPPCSPVNGVSQ